METQFLFCGIETWILNGVQDSKVGWNLINVGANSDFMAKLSFWVRTNSKLHVALKSVIEMCA
jgi:hypothetical protein